MYEYFLFLFYNVVVFLVCLLAWHVLPRPEPYDYTTIPGSKPTPEQEISKEGSLSEIRFSGHLVDYLHTLHESYGNLASFWWGTQYVVSVGSYKLWKELYKYCLTEEHFISGDIFEVLAKGCKDCCDSEKFFSNFEQRLEIAVCVDFQNSYEDKRVSSAQFALQTILSVDFFGQSKHVKEFLHLLLAAEADVEKLYLEGPENVAKAKPYGVLHMSLDLLSWENFLTSHSVDDDDTALRGTAHLANFCLLAYRTFLTTLAAKDDQLFRDLCLTNTSKRREYFYEMMRHSVPVPMFVLFFAHKEIDLEGHPIKPMTPILVASSVIFEDAKVFDSRFEPFRFCLSTKWKPQDTLMFERLCCPGAVSCFDHMYRLWEIFIDKMIRATNLN